MEERQSATVYEQPGRLITHFGGAAVTKLAPPLLQLGLLVLVARAGSLDDVGRLTVASAIAFLCGAIGELGFTTSLSIPRVAFGVEDPPLRWTAPLRIAGGVGGTALYIALWSAGLGGHDHALLLVAPLPCALALSYGYAGSMNASGLLRIEGMVSVAESVAVLALALAGSIVVGALPAALGALTIGRAGGAAVRAILVRRLPQSPVRGSGVVRRQRWYALATFATVWQGQADMLVIGYFGTFAVAAVYGLLLRSAASVVLIAEAFTWALYGRAHPAERQELGRIGQHWRAAALAAAVAFAGIFLVLARPFLHLVLNRHVGIGAAIVLFAGVIVVRFAMLVLNVDILRAGRQREQIPIVGLAAIALAVGAFVAVRAHSLTGLGAARIGSEFVIAAGFFGLSRLAPRRGDPVMKPLRTIDDPS